MITLRPSAAWGLRVAGRILLLCTVHASPVLAEHRFQNVHAQGGQALGRDLKFTHLTTNDGLSQDNIVATLQDRRGFMWFATNGGGLNRYDGNTFVVYQNSPDDPNTLSANSTQCLIEDDHGDLRIGTWGWSARQVRSNDRTLYPLPVQPRQPQQP